MCLMAALAASDLHEQATSGSGVFLNRGHQHAAHATAPGGFIDHQCHESPELPRDLQNRSDMESGDTHEPVPVVRNGK
jgi:hypothetical protein